MAKYSAFSRRATEARAGKLFNSKPMKAALWLLLLALIAFGVLTIVLYKNSLGWILCGLAALPLEILIYGCLLYTSPSPRDRG